MKPNKKVTWIIRKATLHDVREVHALIKGYAKQKKLLPRSLSYMYDNVRDFYVCVTTKGKLIGCCALHVVWEDLAEIKSLVVSGAYQGRSIGRQLVTHCIDEAKELGVQRVFALTYEVAFFQKNKFRIIDKSKLPAKVWRECMECPLFPDCEEVAVVRRL